MKFKPRKKKEVMPWREGLLSHHNHRPTRADRNEFPDSVVKELKAEAGGKCQCCNILPDETTHHVMPRARGGRGVKKNGMRVSGKCHDRIQTNEDELQYWISVYRGKYGDNFWFDELDWEDYERSKQHSDRMEAERNERTEQLDSLLLLLNKAIGRTVPPADWSYIKALLVNKRDILLLKEILRKLCGKVGAGK